MEALLQAAPSLRRVEVDMEMTPRQACTLLRRLPPFGALRVLNARIQLQASMEELEIIGAAVEKDTTIKSLTLKGVGLFRTGPSVFRRFLARLTGHPSLEQLSITKDPVGPHAAAAGAALGELVAADSPSLKALCVWQTGNLYDVGMAPLLDALAMNSHLETLKCNGNGASHAFARLRLLPAVQASSLRSLSAGKHGVMAAAQRFVRHREAARQAALGEAV